MAKPQKDLVFTPQAKRHCVQPFATTPARNTRIAGRSAGLGLSLSLHIYFPHFQAADLRLPPASVRVVEADLA
jgi:hypothetical protein